MRNPGVWWNKRATVLYLLERWAEAVTACQQAVALNPAHYGALSGAAMCSIKMGDEDAAERFFSSALAVNPRLVAAKHYGAVLRRRRESRAQERERGGGRSEPGSSAD